MAIGDYVGGQGPHDAKIVIVGEAPGKHEDETGIPFSGPSGRLLDELLLEVGIRRSDCYVTNVVKYRPPFNDLRQLKTIGHSIEEGIPQLWNEIGEINPNLIIALGNLSLKTLTGKGTGSSGIQLYRGSLLPSSSMDYKVLPTIHPAAFLHSEGDGPGAMKYGMRYIVKMDLARALEESQTKRLETPHRVLEIIRDSVALQRYIERYYPANANKIVSVDIETVYGIPVCIALAFNDWHGVSIPLLDIMKWQNLEGIPVHELAAMWKIIAWLLSRKDVLVIGQNIKFDEDKLANICGIKIKNIYCDNMLLAAAIHCEFEKSQAFLASIYTKEPYYKDEGKEFNWKKDKVDRLLYYNAKDAVVAYEIFLKLIEAAKELQVPGFPNWLDSFFFGYQMKLHEFYRDIEYVGLLVDNERRKELIKEYEEKIKFAEKELNEIAGWEVNSNSPPQVSVLLFKQFKLPQRQGVDEDTLVALEANTVKKPEQKRALELILLIRRLRKSKGTYFEAKPDYDGRMRTSIRICGAETGRTSNSLLKPPIRPTKVGLAFQTMTKHGDIGVELRSYFIADPGYSFVEIDLSQAEARIVALLARDEKLLDLFARKEDVHRLTAHWIFDVPAPAITTELRFIGKTTRHAGGYGMKKHRLMNIVNTDAKKFHININISEWKAGKILDKFHAFSPNIRGVFHEEIIQALNENNRTLVTPFGRYRQFFDRWGEDLFKEAFAHIPQSTVPDHVRFSAFRALDRFREDKVIPRFIGGKTPFALEAHDALLGIVPDDYVNRYIQIMIGELEVPIDFSRCTLSRGSLVIPAEAKVGKTYKECKIKGCTGCKNMHDYKLES